MGIKNSVQKSLGNLKDMMTTLNTRTYFDVGKNRDSLNSLKDDMDKSIDSLVAKTNDYQGVSISKLYSREDVTDSKGLDEFKNMFEDNSTVDSLMSAYMENKCIREMDNEIDTICNFMTKLQDAIDFKTDMVLSADDISKEFLICKNLTSVSYPEQFSSKMQALKDEYNLNILIEEILADTNKYGEKFIYTPSYSKELSRLLKHKKANPAMYTESVTLESSGLLLETCIDSNDRVFDEKEDKQFLEEFSNLTIEFSKSPMIETIAENAQVINESKNLAAKIFAKDEELESEYLKASENIIDTNKVKDKDPNIKINGCIVRKLKRENVIPVYIDDVCLGYYYIETTLNNGFDYVETLRRPTSTVLSKNKYSNANAIGEEERKEAFIRKLSGVLTSKIDEKFINTNQGLKNEIYLLLKYHNLNSANGSLSKIKVTFIPPEDMVHFYFRQDPKTHRGISDLQRSLFPAKLYTCLYIFNGIGTLTRSQDKRAFFVKQHVDTNIAGLLMNTINQIKKGNFGFREMGNLDNILGMTGRFNDYVIPTSGSGERPIDFEIIPGQEMRIDQDFMDSLESLAINATNIPLEAIEAKRTVEFSRQITTSNGRVARHVVKRQALFQVPCGKLLTRIWNTTYNENEIIQVLLPPPSYLLVSNMMDMFNNINSVVDSAISVDLTDEERNSEMGMEYRRLLMKQWMGGYLNMGNMQNLKQIAELNVATKKKQQEEM